MRIRRLIQLISGAREVSPPLPPTERLEEAQKRLLTAQTDFFKVVAGVVEENNRLRGQVHAKKNSSQP